MERFYNISCDIKTGAVKAPSDMFFVQNDLNVCGFNIQINDNEMSVDLTGKFATISFLRIDGERIVGTVEEFNLEQGKLQYLLGASEIEVPGKVIASVELFDGTAENPQRLSTLSFSFKIIAEIGGENAVPSDNDRMPILTDLIMQVQEAVEGVESGAFTADRANKDGDGNNIKATYSTKTEVASLTKSNVGLGNCDNTSDLDKPVSTAVQTALNLKQNASEKNQANGYCGLGADGKVETSQLPAIAITDTFEVASQSAMLALTAQKGDVAIRSDINKSYILSAEPASTLSNWKELKTPTDTVLSVNGKTGAVTIAKSDVGLVNVDNTSDLDKPVSTAVQTALNLKQNTSEKNMASGYCGLDSSGKVASAQLPTPIVMGTYTVDVAYKTGTLSVDSTTDIFTLTAHGFVNGDVVEFDAGTGALPGGLSASDYYYIIEKTNDTFKLCATFGGSLAVDITSNGTTGYKVRLAGVSEISFTGLNLSTDKKYAINASGRIALKAASDSICSTLNIYTSPNFSYFSSASATNRTSYIINQTGTAKKYNEFAFNGIVWYATSTVVAMSMIGGVVNSDVIDFTSSTSTSQINNGGKARNVTENITSLKIFMGLGSLIRNGSVIQIERAV